jgi:8-oxo-dGTP pyrophosphatase MutT (NUDIX family)
MASDLETLLNQHEAYDAREAMDLAAMRDYAATLNEPFSRSEQKAHFTGSAVVVDPTGTQVCLVHHARLERWLQPGGHAEPADGGLMAKTALREGTEETGLTLLPWPDAPQPLDVDVHVIPSRKGEPQHEHLDVRYLFLATDPHLLTHDAQESHGAQWVSWAEALTRATEAPMRRMLEKARAHVERHPAVMEPRRP